MVRILLHYTWTFPHIISSTWLNYIQLSKWGFVLTVTFTQRWLIWEGRLLSVSFCEDTSVTRELSSLVLWSVYWYDDNDDDMRVINQLVKHVIFALHSIPSYLALTISATGVPIRGFPASWISDTHHSLSETLFYVYSNNVNANTIRLCDHMTK